MTIKSIKFDEENVKWTFGLMRDKIAAAERVTRNNLLNNESQNTFESFAASLKSDAMWLTLVKVLVQDEANIRLPVRIAR